MATLTWILGTLGTLLALAWLLITVFAADHFTRPQRIGTLDDPSFAGLDCEPVRFRSRGDGLDLAAWYLPARDATRAVVFVHGCNGGKGLELRSPSFQLAARLIARGISVLQIDLRGHGESQAARMTYGIRERRDVLGAVDWLLARGYARGSIGVLGASMGGASVLGAASEETAIGAVVVDSAFSDLREVLHRQFVRVAGLPAIFLPGVLALAQWLAGEKFADFRPLELARKLRGRPLFFVHAEGDPLIDHRHASVLAEVAGASAWITSGVGHIYSFLECPTEYALRVGDFLVENLVPTQLVAHALGCTGVAAKKRAPRSRRARARARALALRPQYLTLQPYGRVLATLTVLPAIASPRAART